MPVENIMDKVHCIAQNLTAVLLKLQRHAGVGPRRHMGALKRLFNIFFGTIKLTMPEDQLLSQPLSNPTAPA